MRERRLDIASDLPSHASTGMDSGAAQPWAADDEVDLEFVETGQLPPRGRPAAWTVDQQVGLAIRRLRLYRGLSQTSLERICGIDQTTISRLETARCRGLHIRRLFAILTAL